MTYEHIRHSHRSENYSSKTLPIPVAYTLLAVFTFTLLHRSYKWFYYHIIQQQKIAELLQTAFHSPHAHVAVL
jgi:hypothetical protein